jgi:hypothetical protein
MATIHQCRDCGLLHEVRPRAWDPSRCGHAGEDDEGMPVLCTMIARHHSSQHSVEYRERDGAKVTRWWWR